jgi:hypothetical protein
LKHDKVLSKYLWLAMIPLFISVASLTIPQIDTLPISIDEHTSMWNAGNNPDGPYSPLEIISSLNDYSAQHTPGYFLALGLWGNLTGWHPPILRVLAIFMSLLAMAWTFRLGRDLASPQAGFVATILLSSLTFYTIYNVHIRMYPFLMVTVAFMLWIYLRIIYKRQSPTQLEYLGLFLGTLFLLSAHVFSLTLLASLGLYHLLFVSKNRRWMQISGIVIMAGLVFSPYSIVLLNGFNHTRTVISLRDSSMTALEILLSTAYLFSNGTYLILVLAVGLAVLAWRKSHPRVFPMLWLSGVTLLIIIGLNQIFNLIPIDRSRYLLVLWIPLSVAMATGVMQVARWRILSLLMIVVWLGSGLWMHTTIDYPLYTGGRGEMWLSPSVQHISSALTDHMTDNDRILGYTNTLHLESKGRHGPSVSNYYFSSNGMSAKYIYLDRDTLSLDDARLKTLEVIAGQPSIWFTYQPNLPRADYLKVAHNALTEHHKLCEIQEIDGDVTLEYYVWKGLDCQPITSETTITYDDITITNMDALLSDDQSTLTIVGHWEVAKEFPETTYNISYQVITADWQNVAQHDEFVITGKPRWTQVTLPTESLEAGDYRVMIVIYHWQTGEKLTGHINHSEEEGTLLTVDSFSIIDK